MTGDKAVVRTEDGLVENVIVADDDFDPGDGCYLVDVGDRRCSPGDVYDDANDEFVEADRPEPDPALEERLEDIEYRLAALEHEIL